MQRLVESLITNPNDQDTKLSIQIFLKTGPATRVLRCLKGSTLRTSGLPLGLVIKTHDGRVIPSNGELTDLATYSIQPA